MSAIAGLWRFDGMPETAADCARMLAAQHIYGPHEGGLWAEGALAMGRRLFRRVPEDVFDRQPLQSRDGRLVLTADVRLDNRDELCGMLGLPSGQTHALCDADVLLACFERWDGGALDRVAGDFALALWDARAQRLMLARDVRGQAPLHYHRGRGFVAFASMPKGLHALADIPRAPDEETVAEFIALIPQTTSRSYFAGIERVKPGHVFTLTRDGVSIRRYWQPQRPGRSRMSAADAIDGVRHHLDQATKSRLRGAAGLVGTHLSAGLDSAAVTATAARLMAAGGGRVVAFTAVPRDGYDGPRRPHRVADEGPLAAETAALYPNIEHVLIRSGHLSPLAGLDRDFFLCERPLLNLCNWVWVREINNAARSRGINILLTGQMGNATVSYQGFELFAELLRTGRLVRLWREATRLSEKTGMGWRSVLAKVFGPFAPPWLWHGVNELSGKPKRDPLFSTAIRADRVAAFDLAALAGERDLDFTKRPRLDSFAMRVAAVNRVDVGNGNKGILGGWGIDMRDPFADRRLVEFCLSVPTEHFLSDGMPRALARRALADRLPSAVLSAPKGEQAADWHEGLTAARPQLEEELARLPSRAPAAQALDIERLQGLVENWPSSGWERDDRIKPYRLALLRGVSAGHFLRKATGSNLMHTKSCNFK